MSTPSTLVAGRYRLVKLLGAGGMGVVWQAWDERLERQVALKMLRTQPELTDQEREVATNRAMREARITAGLHHPHAVTVYDVVEHEGRPCLVMQLIESTPLSILLREHGTLTPGQTARIGAQVSSALAAAHKLRIVHRDVKPGNVLITADGSAKISDFGISHALGDATITATGMIHGTPAYLAPEVARGRPSSFAADVFSLGSTLYAMLEGDPPFGADQNAIALLHKVARGAYPRPKHAGSLAPLLRLMLSADPKRRPSMTAIAASLSEVQSAAPRKTLPKQNAALIPSGMLLDATTVALPDDESTATTETPDGAVPVFKKPASPSATLQVAHVVETEPPTAETVEVAAAADDEPTSAAETTQTADAVEDDTSTPESPEESDAVEDEPTATPETSDESDAVEDEPSEPVSPEGARGIEGEPVSAAEVPTIAATAATEALTDSFARTDRGDATDETAETSNPPTAVTVTAPLEDAYYRQEPTLAAPPGRTVPLDQPSRFEPPTAETEPLGKAASAAAIAPYAIPRRPPVPTAPGALPPRPRRRRVGAVVGILVLVGVLVVGAVLLFNPFRVNEGISAAPTPSETPRPTDTPASETPTATPTPTPTVSTPPPAPVVQEPPPPTPEERVVQTITSYYALVPGNLDGAWPTMTADYQQNHAGGRGNYDAFWAAIGEVQVSDVAAFAPDQGQATLTYYYNDGRVIQEVTSYQLVDEGGVLKIAASEVISSVDL